MLPEKAIYFPDLGILGVADTHFGKAASFRSEGVLVPRGHTEDDFVRLAKLIRKTQPNKIVIMGDLIHSKHSKTDLLAEMASAWRSLFQDIELILLKGNHDKASGKIPDAFGFDSILEKLEIGDILMQHEPEEVEDKYILCGHLHPGISVPDKVTGKLKLPCFHFTQFFGIIPAFGSFTGLSVLKRNKGDSIYAIAENTVFKI